MTRQTPPPTGPRPVGCPVCPSCPSCEEQEAIFQEKLDRIGSRDWESLYHSCNVQYSRLVQSYNDPWYNFGLRLKDGQALMCPRDASTKRLSTLEDAEQFLKATCRKREKDWGWTSSNWSPNTSRWENIQ